MRNILTLEEVKKMQLKKYVGLSILACLLFNVIGCGVSNNKDTKASADTDKKIHLTVFAAASMTETMNTIAENYQKSHPNVEITYNFDSSGTLKTQIQNGAACDLFISAAPKQMNQLDASKGEAENPQKLDYVLQGTRFNLLENKVALVAPEDNPKHIKDFEDMAEKLKNGSIRLVMGNSDVPVGQYTQKILAFYKLDETALAEAGHISYGSNVKEVTTQVKEGSADCGIIYSTDAFSAGLTPLELAAQSMCGQVIYPAAVMKNSKNQEAATEFLKYLQSEEAMKVFEGVGFSKIS